MAEELNLFKSLASAATSFSLSIFFLELNVTHYLGKAYLFKVFSCAKSVVIAFYSLQLLSYVKLLRAKQ